MSANEYSSIVFYNLAQNNTTMKTKKCTKCKREIQYSTHTSTIFLSHHINCNKICYFLSSTPSVLKGRELWQRLQRTLNNLKKLLQTIPDLGDKKALACYRIASEHIVRYNMEIEKKVVIIFILNRKMA